jgi:hypothetical protein
MDLFLNITRNLLMSGSAGLDAREALLWSQNEVFPVRLFLLADDGTNPTVLTDLPSPFTTIVLGARPEANLEDDQGFLFSATEWTKTGTGSGTHWATILNLNTEGLNRYLPGSNKDKSLPVLIDIELQNDDNTRQEKILRHNRALILRDIARGNEGVPTSGNPPYPLPGQLVLRAPANANYRVKDGTTFQLYNTTTGKWHSVWLTGPDGAAALTHSASGES